MKSLVALCLFIISFSSLLFSQEKKLTAEEYVALYKDIAIKEMNRSGVPASIKLAQGLHESANGNSQVAKNANNHFGLKAQKDWTGDVYLRIDEKGDTTAFRSYKTVEESYIDQSNNFKKKKNYAFLFELAPTDIEGWANGLLKAGYASNPHYPEKLLETIEKYHLHQYDLPQEAVVVVKEEPKKKDTIVVIVEPAGVAPVVVESTTSLFKEYKEGTFKQNDVEYVVANKNESAFSVAENLNIPYRKFLAYNDLDEDAELIDFQYIYLKAKKNSYKGKEKTHKVEKGQSLYMIAQYYGIKLKSLRKLNHLEPGAEPLSGDTLYLKKK